MDDMSRRFRSGDGFLLINEKLQKKKGKKYKGSGTTFLRDSKNIQR